MIGLRPFGLGGCGEGRCQDGRHGILCVPIDTLVGKIHYKFVVGCIRNIFWKQSLTSIVFAMGKWHIVCTGSTEMEIVMTTENGK
jgi:hypothetical protein